MDVYGPLNVSLDYRLRFSPTVVKIINQLLDVICKALTSLKPTNDPPQTPSRKRHRISENGGSEVTRRAPSHNSIIFDQEIEYQDHSIKEHGVPEMHAGTLSNATRRLVLEKVQECPFGDDVQLSEKVEPGAVFLSEAPRHSGAAGGGWMKSDIGHRRYVFVKAMASS
ncbi:hypothetical protein DSL72_003791 [Monilinia vaccinii-corymbosi]|uniref:Uncharacterized protein n=1 Tax=Monilinia vaccinii-corymbosi TaxID=61207 RepID=A0A8A3P895_9HELO|nr:hypothetical protein DSL72_003791 [Monilinia vaccinii-corymbosi]